MNTFKRVLLYAGMVISIIVLVLCVAGIIGAWAYNDPATEFVLGIITPITNVMGRVETIADETGNSLEAVRTGLDNVETGVEEIADGVIEADLGVEAVSLIVGEDIRPALENAGDSVRSVYEVVVNLEESIDSINAIPFLNLDLPGAEELGRLRTGMEEVATSVDEAVTNVQARKAEIVTGAATEINASVNRIDTRVDEMRTNLGDLEAQAGVSYVRLLALQGDLPGWIDLLSIAVTLILIWFIISQVAVFVFCRKSLQGKIA